MSGRRLAITGALFAVVWLLAGCLDFDEQTVYVEHDAANDRLLVVVDYGGFYAKPGPSFSLWGEPVRPDPADADPAEALHQLREAIENKTVAFLGNWPFAFPIARLREDLAEPDPDLPEELRGDLISLLSHVRVLNGGFYADPRGRVCGAQVVIVDNVAEALRLANRLISASILCGAAGSQPDDLAEAMLVEYARRGDTWIHLDGHSIVATMPLPEGHFKELREKFVADVFDMSDDEVGTRFQALRSLFMNPVLVWHERDQMRVRCGYVAEPSTLVTKAAHGDYVPNMVEQIVEDQGLAVDGRLARYLVEADTQVHEDADFAAQIMAPRLGQRERVRVLVHKLRAEPSPAYWELLRSEERPPAAVLEQETPSDDELLEFWDQWLRGQYGVVEEVGETARITGQP